MTAKASVGRKQRGKGFKEDLKASRVISNSIGHIVGDIGKAGIKVLYPDINDKLATNIGTALNMYGKELSHKMTGYGLLNPKGSLGSMGGLKGRGTGAITTNGYGSNQGGLVSVQGFFPNEPFSLKVANNVRGGRNLGTKLNGSGLRGGMSDIYSPNSSSYGMIKF